MSVQLVGLALLMALATYPWRAIPLLAPGIEGLPGWLLAYLRLVGPAVLAALAAVSVIVVLGPGRVPAFRVGIEWLAVALCIVVVVRWRNLLAGLIAATVLVAVFRALSVTPLS